MFNRNRLAAFIACAIAPQAAATVFMSEYIEGASYDKGIEIYNAGNSDVDLSSYQIKVFFNGNSTASTSISLDGTLEAGEFFLYAHSDASFASAAQLTSGASLFNGDDAVVLYNGDTVVDSLGQVGFDPGSEWSVNGVDTQNRGLRRLAVTTDTNISDEFDPSEQWQAFDNEDFSDLLAFNGDGGTGDGGNDDEDPGNGESMFVVVPHQQLVSCKAAAM
ncbi:lamin tail domain-containing protein [Neiella marina]|uniref:Lamin tail domain-containing protein n=1 Tax=Neiella holothuriorum TaxID=2870530 RepID=A0ABS7EHB2_9GAMM|nr:lamin tail domain-containing protein [Neiella holothuriorum]MBW8191739.1 lamin tail domain-containing protein [Neiella holothuriorum]